MRHTTPRRRWALNGKLAIPILTLLIVFCSRAALAQSPPTGPAGGDLTGTYPNPTLAVDRVRKTGDTITGYIDITVPNGGVIPVPFTIASFGNPLLNRGTAMAFNVPAGGTTSLLGGKIASVWGGNNQTYMSFSAYNSGAFNEIFRMDGRGFFGIGTANPTSKLHVVSGTDSATTMLSLDTGVHGGTAMTVGGTVNNESTFDLSVYRAGSYASRFGVSSAGNVYFQPGGGNVGIGATTPVSPLHVAGVTPRINIQDTTGGGSNFALISRLNRLEVAIHGVNTIASFLSSGNVGIGTTAPASKLEVLGTIHSTSGGFKFPDGSVQTTAGGGSVTSVFTRVGVVTAAQDDYTWAQINKTVSNLADLTTRSATDLTSGTLPAARFPATLPAASGANLTALNATQLTSGTVPDARFPATLPALSGANLTSLNATNLSSGTVAAARMPALTGDVTTSVGTVATTLSNTGVIAGSYTNANITVNSKGRITLASNGSGGSTAFSDITAGINTVALVVGPNGSLGVSGTGAINATSLANAANITGGTVPITRLGTGTPDSTKFLRGDNTWTAITSSQWTTGTGNISYTAGNVGIGVTPTPNSSYKLDVAGNINSSGTITGNIINAKYQDLAEWVPSSEQLSAGTVVVLDTTKSNQVISSTASYDTRVAGVISAQPGITLGEGGEGKVLVATTGRVRVKVDASRGPIQIGDLLVTSDVPGLAMKSEAVEFAGRKMHMPGTIIGKALEPMARGSGEILVLLSLQ